LKYSTYFTTLKVTEKTRVPLAGFDAIMSIIQ